MKKFILSMAVIVAVAPATTVSAQQDTPFEALLAPPEVLGRVTGGDVPRVPEGNLTRQVISAIEGRAAAGGERDRVHVILSLTVPASSDLFEALAERGVQVKEQAAPGLFIAEASAEGAAALERIEFIEDARLMPPSAKISPLFGAEDDEDVAREGGTRTLSVIFQGGVSPEEAANAMASVGADVGRFAESAFATTRTMPVQIPVSQIGELLSLDVVRVIEPLAPPDINFNQANAQPLSNVDDVQGPPFSLTGAGVTMGIWEAGAVVLATHQDLTPRVTVQAGQTASLSRHANHVAGTMAASGVNTPAAEGMAPAANLWSWDSGGDFGEMTPVAAPTASPRVSVSNHSYGQRVGWDPGSGTWNNNQARFGQYTAADTQALDRVIAGDQFGAVATELVSVWAAGNDRNDAPFGGIMGGPADCFQNGIVVGGVAVAADCIGVDAIAKNVITVGAMNGAGAIANFSSFGPTDDNRIKPDLVAQGVNVFSLGNAPPAAQTNTGTSTTQGTSMASPVVAGIAGLMTEEFNNRGLRPLAASYKAILIQTARDVAGIGQSRVGPDFATGWGIADAEAALELVDRAGGPGFAEGTLTNTGVANAWTFPFVVPAGEPELRVTLAWSDLPGAPAAGGVVGGGLVNDLDLRLIPPGGGAAFQPWTLNAAQPTVPAVRNGGDDATNNVEQVSVVTPPAGTWTAQVSAKAGSLAFGGQPFAIAGPITPDGGPIVGPKSNIVMTLDKSGSMILPSATAGLNKMQSLQSAANAFVDYIELVGGHNLSIVAFDSGVVGTSPNVPMGPLDATSAGAARTAVENLSPGGSTNIIAAVMEASSRISSPQADNADDTVFLFSDGRHNTPSGSDLTVIDGIMADDTRFFSIGFGTDVDSSILQGVSTNHDGVHLEEQNLSIGQLAKLFMVVGGLVADESIVLDPNYSLSAGDAITESIYITEGGRTLTFAAFWDENAAELDFDVVGPNRRCKIPNSPHAGFQTRRGPRYALIRVTLPYTCQGKVFGDANQHAGSWTLRARHGGGQPVGLTVMALADSQIDLTTRVMAKGKDALLTARLIDGDSVLVKGVRMRAEITPNRPATGDSGRQDLMTQDIPNPGEAVGSVFSPIFGTVRADRLFLVPQAEVSVRPGAGLVASERAVRPSAVVEARRTPSINAELIKRAERLALNPLVLERLRGRAMQKPGPFTVQLRDDGTGGDRKANDGVFSAAIRATSPTLHQVRVIASQPMSGGLLTREALTSYLAQ